MYYAHSGNSAHREHWHPLSKHLEGTGARAAAFLERTGFSDCGRAAGLLHDLGKYTGKFQARLRGGGRVNHSTAGAVEAINRYGERLGKMLAFCVAGHHAGLANGVNGERIGALDKRLGGEFLQLDPAWRDEITLPDITTPRLLPRDKNNTGFCAAFFVRMLFSALVDADFLDTEAYYDSLEGKERLRGQHPALSDLLQRFNVHIEALMTDADSSPVNDLRQEVLRHTRSKADKPPGMFSLTVPTGGGKTLTSLAFALDHAVRHGLDRVIYVIPYMSIIEQTAAVFRKALRGDEDDRVDFVIEHHSTFDEERMGSREAKDKLRLAMENWDAPIIVTTAVQFFESLFASRPSRCRKLHNIANSVVILDEAQTLPLKFLRPSVAALDELVRNWRTTVVLCTATQPALLEADEFPGGFKEVEELAPDPKNLYRKLRRTRIDHQGEVNDAQLAARLRDSPQALCIVNTRRHARELYEQIGDAEGAFHLTTLMCAQHRRERLDAVRERLKRGAPVRLIATSLVEAGVDVDFPVVWRAEAGLESIIQAAGRCNREGREDLGDVFVFEPAAGEGRKPPPEIGQFADAARSIMRRYDDPMCLEAISAYFRDLYWAKTQDALDGSQILRLLEERCASLDFPFETIAGKFRLIETAMSPVIVPYQGAYDDGEAVRRLLEDLKWVERPGRTARKLQPYAVQVPPFARAALLAAGALEVLGEEKFEKQFMALTNLDLYREDVGLTWDDPTFQKAEGLLY